MKSFTLGKFFKVVIPLFVIALAGVCFLFFSKKAFIVSLQKTDPESAMYFWQTRWQTTSGMLTYLSEANISKLYVRFFDVELDKSRNTPFPSATIQFVSSIPQGVKIVPVVYFVNNVFMSLPDKEIRTLAQNILTKVVTLAQNNGISLNEAQFDCDWTETTRGKYFAFLRELKSLTGLSPVTRNLVISSTVRLHQIKYFARTGVPPVDRGMLMFYNMGKLSPEDEKISIFNKEDAEKYAFSIGGYPLPLDLVLPMFSWALQVRDGRIVALIESLSSDEFDSKTELFTKQENLYLAKESFFFRGRYFKQNDIVRFETVTKALTREAASLAAENRPKKGPFSTIAFFDLNERNVKDHEPSFFKQITAIFK